MYTKPVMVKKRSYFKFPDATHTILRLTAPLENINDLIYYKVELNACRGVEDRYNPDDYVEIILIPYEVEELINLYLKSEKENENERKYTKK